MCKGTSHCLPWKCYVTDVNKICNDYYNTENPQPPSRCAQQMPVVMLTPTMQTYTCHAGVAVAMLTP